nr:4794_t:CDS:2 [Entrophospora candida]
MSDNSPCFPLYRNNFHQSTFHHPNGTIRNIRSLEDHNNNQSHPSFQRFTALHQQQQHHHLSKVTGKRKSGEDSDDSMGEPRSPPYSRNEMERDNGGNGSNNNNTIHKRTKLGNDKNFPLSKLLATLDKSQLLSLINNLIDSHPNLQSEISSNVPRPTIHSVSTVLAGLEKRYHDSFPYSKWGHLKDDYSFNRVKPAILDLKAAIIDYADHFTSSEEFPTITFSFLHLVTEIAHRLPEWDNRSHNEIKHDLYLKLVEYWQKATREAANKISDGKIYGQTVVNEWARNLEQHNNNSNGIFQQTLNEFIEKLGWIIGASPNSPFLTSSGNGGMIGNHHHSHNHHQFSRISV